MSTIFVFGTIKNNSEYDVMIFSSLEKRFDLQNMFMYSSMLYIRIRFMNHTKRLTFCANNQRKSKL